MNMVHKLDLMRCYSQNQYEKSLQVVNDNYVVSSSKQQDDFQNLQRMVTQALVATGDIIFGDHIFSRSKERYSTEFAVASVDSREGLLMIDQAVKAIYQPSSQNQEQMRAIGNNSQEFYGLLISKLTAQEIESLLPFINISLARNPNEFLQVNPNPYLDYSLIDSIHLFRDVSTDKIRVEFRGADSTPLMRYDYQNFKYILASVLKEFNQNQQMQNHFICCIMNNNNSPLLDQLQMKKTEVITHFQPDTSDFSKYKIILNDRATNKTREVQINTFDLIKSLSSSCIKQNINFEFLITLEKLKRDISKSLSIANPKWTVRFHYGMNQDQFISKTSKLGFLTKSKVDKYNAIVKLGNLFNQSNGNGPDTQKLLGGLIDVIYLSLKKGEGSIVAKECKVLLLKYRDQGLFEKKTIETIIDSKNSKTLSQFMEEQPSPTGHLPKNSKRKM